jgi:hypothetical protein
LRKDKEITWNEGFLMVFGGDGLVVGRMQIAGVTPSWTLDMRIATDGTRGAEDTLARIYQ